MGVFSKFTALDRRAFGPPGAEPAMPRRQALWLALALVAMGLAMAALGLLSGYMSAPLAVVIVVLGLALGLLLTRPHQG